MNDQVVDFEGKPFVVTFTKGIPLTLHLDDSHQGSDDHWYECDQCGHTKEITDVWAKATAHGAAQALPSTDDEPF